MFFYTVIFTKGGVVLWKDNPFNHNYSTCINNLIRSVILEEKYAERYFEQENLAVQLKLDNERKLVFATVFPKFIDFPIADRYLVELQSLYDTHYKQSLSPQSSFDFQQAYNNYQQTAKSYEPAKSPPKQMRTFDESLKSKKTVSSLIEDNSKGDKKKVNIQDIQKVNGSSDQQLSNEEIILENRKKFLQKTSKKSLEKKKNEKVKQPRRWELEGDAKDALVLDRSKENSDGVQYQKIQNEIVGTMQGGIQDLELKINNEDVIKNDSKKNSGILSYLKGIVGSKKLSRNDLNPVLEKMREHLISKNVASEIAAKLCESIAMNLEGKALSTLDSTASLIKDALTKSLIRILSPKRRIDIIRDALESRKHGTPYVIIFCGVNGVGKSTNLAKICFWLIENDFNVLIAACDTFRAGAVEQLRTHTRHINALHPAEKHNNRTMVQLYEKGYGKDAAGIAMEAIKFANDTKIDVVLVDTAGRMQDNEPLMRSLSKLIKVNNPDLVLFVGEALVGNEAVDQLVKFNQSLADYSSNENPHIIDGIVLTKFDTIDDKVGAAISMTYITGQPIVFVGTGQTYSDLKALNVNAVVHSLMK